MRGPVLSFVVGVSLLCAVQSSSAGSRSPVTGTISGRITGADGYGLHLVAVRIAGLEGFVPEVWTDINGDYTMNGLPEGAYYVHTANQQGYINEVWHQGQPDRYCAYGCDPATAGAPVVIDDSTPVHTNVDLELERGARFEFTALDADTLERIAYMGVDLFDDAGRLIASGWTLVDAYTVPPTDKVAVFDGVPPGRYYAATHDRDVQVAEPYLAELWEGHACPFFTCDPTSGTPIVVSGTGAVTEAFAFVLEKGGRITGDLIDAAGHTRIAGGRVQIFDAAGTALGSVVANSSGWYGFPGIPFGTYRLATGPTSGRMDELWDDHLCPGGACDATGGDAVVVSADAPAAVADFVLEGGSSLGGTVRDAVGRAPLPDVQVRLYDVLGRRLPGAAVTDASGVYSFGVLQAGTYYAVAASGTGYIDEAWDGLWCPHESCDMRQAASITIGPAAAATADFELDAGGAIAGTVRDSGGDRIAGAIVQVYNGHGGLIAEAVAAGTGDYRVDGLTPGAYFARTFTESRFRDELWNGGFCAGTCVVTAGTPIAVESGMTAGVPFVLERAGSIAGRVTEHGTATGLTGIPLEVFDGSGVRRGATATGVAGSYRVSGLSAGAYHVRTNTAAGYLNEVWDNRLCAGLTCGATSGTPVVVGADAETANIDFSLAPAGRIQGTVVDGSSASPLVGAVVEAFDAGGNLMRTVTGGGDGAFTIDGLPSGTFYLAASGVPGYVAALHGGTRYFAYTDVTTATGVEVTAGAIASGIEIALERGRVFEGRVARAADGLPAPARIEVFDLLGRLALSFQAIGEYRSPGLPDGQYHLLANGQDGLLSQLSGGVPCSLGRCSVSSGTPIVLPTETPADFVLQRGGRIAGTVKPAGGDRPALVEVFDGVGLATAVTASGRLASYFTETGLPAGDYAARAVIPGHGARVWSNVSCPGNTCAPFAIGDPIGVAVAVTATASFDAPACPLVSVAPGAVPEAVTGQDYRVEFTADGGTAPYAYSISGRLPAGLGLSAAGILEGTAEAAGGWFRATVRAADDNGCFGERDIYLPVVPEGTTPAPTLSSIDPAEGPAAGGTTVAVTGTGFVDGATVTFGTAASASVTVVSETQLTAVTPPLGGGPGMPARTAERTTVDVTVTNPDARSASLRAAFTYVAPAAAPVIDAVEPVSGPAGGGTVVTLTGSGFQDGATVTFGGTGAAVVQWLSSTTLEVTTPAHDAGPVDLVVTNPDGQWASVAEAFSFAAPPVVTAVHPDAGPVFGGTTVTITGTGFRDGATVTFDGTEAWDPVVVSATAITCITPGQTVGAVVRPRAGSAVDVTVTNPDGQASTLTGAFTYQGPPEVTGVSPAEGPESGGTLITITGAGFVTGALVRMSGNDAADVQVVSVTQITARTPAGFAGISDVTVDNPDGQSATLEGAFTYVASPEVYYVDPSQGSRTGGTAVTIVGANFQAGAQVRFDTVSATSTVVVDAGTITARTPVHAPGVVSVVVTNPDGQATTFADGFTYLDYPPDLRVSSLVVPAAAGPGQTILVKDTTINSGQGAAPVTTTGFVLSEDAVLDEDDDPLGLRLVPALSPSQAHAGAASLMIPADTPSGTYYIIAVANSFGEADEASIANNTFARPIPISVDVLVTALTAPAGASPGDTITVGDTTKNAGKGAAPGSVTAYYLSSDMSLSGDDRRLGSRSVAPLGAGKLHAGSLAVTVPGVAPGAYFVLAVADEGAVLGETNESNNVRSRAIRIGADLTAAALAAPASARPAAAIAVRDTTKNVGAGPAPASTTTIYWSADSVWDPGDTPLASRVVSALNPRGVSVWSHAVTVPADATRGVTYYLIAKTDADDAVAELLESNNLRARAIRVK